MISRNPQKAVAAPPVRLRNPQQPQPEERESCFDPTEQYPCVLVTPDEKAANDQVIQALARHPEVYQRAGALVRLQSNPEGGVQIIDLAKPTLREIVSSIVCFMEERHNRGGTKLVPIHPPIHCINAVAARGLWPDVRLLKGVIHTPILRPDGTVLQTPGYDPQTQLYFQPVGNAVSLCSRPTRADAQAACSTLKEVVCDFPFVTLADRSAWLALVLTPLARQAFRGPTPLFLIGANMSGSGKTLLTDVAAHIVMGREISRVPYPENDAEARKQITAIVRTGSPLVLLDNVSHTIGSHCLDALLTGTWWQDRVLSTSRMIEIPLITTWIATGNDLVVRGDTNRRICHIRLDPGVDNPQERDGFRQPRLLEWVKNQHAELLAAALTILSAYMQAGQPRQNLRPWGSYEGWTDLVRQALVWVGEPDPYQAAPARKILTPQDRALEALIEGWKCLDPQGTGLTARELLRRLQTAESSLDGVRIALQQLCPQRGKKLPSSRSLGNTLRNLQGREIGGKCLRHRKSHNTAVWFVDPIRMGAEGCSAGGSGGSDPVPYMEDPEKLSPRDADGTFLSGHVLDASIQ